MSHNGLFKSNIPTNPVNVFLISNGRQKGSGTLGELLLQDLQHVPAEVLALHQHRRPARPLRRLQPAQHPRQAVSRLLRRLVELHVLSVGGGHPNAPQAGTDGSPSPLGGSKLYNGRSADHVALLGHPLLLLRTPPRVAIFAQEGLFQVRVWDMVRVKVKKSVVRAFGCFFLS